METVDNNASVVVLHLDHLLNELGVDHDSSEWQFFAVAHNLSPLHESLSLSCHLELEFIGNGFESILDWTVQLVEHFEGFEIVFSEEPRNPTFLIVE